MKYKIIKSAVVALTASLSVHLLRRGKHFSPLSLIISIIAAFAANMAMYEVMDKFEGDYSDLDELAQI